MEGPHLVGALLDYGLTPLALLATEPGLANREIASLVGKLSPVVLSESVFRSVVDAENPPGIAAEIEAPAASGEIAAPAVFLEGVQDPANVGAILRSAAAFGVASAVLDRACADPWSPKALRAGAGGHFAVQIHQTSALEKELSRFDGRILCAVPRGGVMLCDANLSGPIGWLFGAEGAGVSPGPRSQAALEVTIPMAPGAESINVAASAAICFYTAFCAESPPWQGASELASGGCR